MFLPGPQHTLHSVLRFSLTGKPCTKLLAWDVLLATLSLVTSAHPSQHSSDGIGFTLKTSLGPIKRWEPPASSRSIPLKRPSS